MVLLETDKFLTELDKCLTASKAKNKGSVFFTMKRYDGRTKPVPRNPAKSPPSPDEYKCLIRVTYEKRKLSTHVALNDLNKFQIAFSALMRSGMSNVGKKAIQTLPINAAPPAAATATASSSSTSTTTSKPSSANVKSKSTKKAP